MTAHVHDVTTTRPECCRVCSHNGDGENSRWWCSLACEFTEDDTCPPSWCPLPVAQPPEDEAVWKDNQPKLGESLRDEIKRLRKERDEAVALLREIEGYHIAFPHDPSCRYCRIGRRIRAYLAGVGR